MNAKSVGLILTAAVFCPFVIGIPFVIGFIALMGSFYVVKEVRTESDRWYLGVPLVIVLLAFTASPILDTLLSSVTDLQSVSTFWTALLLLAPASVAAFLSFPAHQRKKTTIFSMVSAGVSVYAAYLLILLLQSAAVHTSFVLFNGLLPYYLLVGMPLLGICYIVTAWITR
ncbi:MAG: hypothetical protein QMC96_12730 [Methanomicrobiales archaeon]|nr:hypothetical protein [Methanomicrobiales archaeon]